MEAVIEAISEKGKQAVFFGLQKLTRNNRITIRKDIPYGELPQQTLDIYQPATGAAEFTLLFVHGGSWQFGHKNEYAFMGQALASQGITTLVIDYRLFPQVNYPEFVNDVARALSWFAESAEFYGLDQAPLFLMGHSAGSHIALLAALDPDFSRAFGYRQDMIHGVICLAGVYSFRPEKSRLYQQIFPAELSGEQYHKVKPLNFLTPGGTPLYLLHGRKDATVACRSAERMYKNALLVGHPVTLDVRENYGHYAMLFDFLNYGAGHRKTMAALQGFMRDNL